MTVKTINQILLLTDFSEIADYARQYAQIIARQTSSAIGILHIINSPVDWVNLPLEKEKLYPETKARIGSAKAGLATMVNEFSRQGINAAQSLVFNVGVEDIPQYITADKYDLIIMGSHGSLGDRGVNLGSNAQKVIRYSKVPVLIVKTPPRSESFTRIVMASTFEEDQKPYFKEMFSYAAALGTEMDLLYVNTPYHFKETEEIDNMLTAFCEDDAEKNCGKYHVDALNEERGIKFFMSRSQADIFGIATGHRSMLTSLFSSSLSEAVVNHLDIPVLVFHLK